MFAPVHVIAGGVIFLRRRTARFLTRFGGDDGRHGLGHQVGSFQRFHQVGVPHQAAVDDLYVDHLARHPLDLGHTFGQGLVGAEYAGIGLDGLLHLHSQIGGGDRPFGTAQRGKARQGLVDHEIVTNTAGLDGQPLRPSPVPSGAMRFVRVTFETLQIFQDSSHFSVSIVSLDISSGDMSQDRRFCFKCVSA